MSGIVLGTGTVNLSKISQFITLVLITETRKLHLLTRISVVQWDKKSLINKSLVVINNQNY